MSGHEFVGAVVAAAVAAAFLSLGGCAATRPVATLAPAQSEMLASAHDISPSAGLGDRIGSQVFRQNNPALAFYLRPRPLTAEPAVASIPKPILRIPPTMTTASDY